MLKINKKTDLLADWADTLASMGQAIVVFDEDQNMAMATPKARQFLSPFWSVDQWAKLKIPDIMTLCYENSAEDSGPSGMVESILDTFGDAESGFSEIISDPRGNTFLIQIVGFQQTGTIVLIKDISTYINLYKTTKVRDEQREMLLTAIEMATTGIAIFDPNTPKGIILFANQSFCQIADRPRADILGSAFRKILPACSNHLTECSFNRNINGQSKTFSGHVSVTQDIGMIFISDITEQKEKEDQIRHMQRLESVGQLAGGVAHDFNNILGIIKGYSHLLLPQVKENTDATDALSRMLNACDRGSALAEQLLTISRKKKSSTTIATCGAAQAISTIQKLLIPLLPHEIFLDIFPISHCLQINIPEDQLNQIFMNLILNARDAMPQGGTIQIIASAPNQEHPNHAIFKIQDTGTGIPPDVMARIFEPFFTTKELGKGTGLGLAVIYSIIQQYAGTISVDSTIGNGTVFTLYLPAEIRNIPQDISNGASTPIQSDLKGMTIMVVEDEPDLRKPLVTFLTQQNATVLEADDGNHALAVQDDHTDTPIHLLISDIRMPGGLYGDDLARLWRSIRPESKIILMSGYAEGRDISDGCNDIFLKKPMDFQNLLTSISALMHK